MDRLTFLGLFIGFLAIVLGQHFEGGSLWALVNCPAFFIVVGGTLGAVMVQTPISSFKQAFKIIGWVFKPPVYTFEKDRAKLIELSKQSRQLGLLSLEKNLHKEANPLIRQGVELLMMGIDKLIIRQILEAKALAQESLNRSAANVFESMGGYSPTIGIIGAILGLIQVMGHLSEPSELGEGIAVAFVATIYGVAFANLIFLPIANKINHCIDYRLLHDEMIIEGIVAMASSESPHMMALKLSDYG